MTTRLSRTIWSVFVLVLFASSCSQGVVLQNAATLAGANKILQTQKVFGLVDAREGAPASNDCELELRLSTWDQQVLSEYVCIKHTERPISIPEHIALKSTIGVDAERYCDPEFNKTEKGNPGTAGTPCVWNRDYFDRYPFDFSLRSTRTPLSKVISLVRVIRNGRTVYTWTSTTASATETELRVPGSSLTSPEYFKDPVDIGLYILTSGVDEAKKAAASTAQIPVRRWQDTLKNALAAVASEAAPPAVKQELECARAKVEHLVALANELGAADDATRTTFANEARDISIRIDALAQLSESRSKAKPLEVTAVYDSPIGSKEPAPEKLGGVTFSPGTFVAVYQKDGKVTLAKYAPKKPWSPAAKIDLPPANFAGGEFLFKVSTGSRQGSVYAVQVDSGKVTPVDLSVQCTSVSADLEAAHTQYIEATKSLLGDAALRKVGAVAQQARSLSNQMGLSVTQLRQYVSAVVASVPDKQVVDSAGLWLRTVDHAIADSLSAAQMLSTTGTEIEESVKTAIKDPQAQLRAYEAFAQRLPTEDTLYTAAVRNVPPGDGESSLAMTYHRPRQSYYLLAWNAVPVPVSSQSQAKVELRLENLIPIIDVIGWHWQGKSWKQLFHGGGVGLGVMGTRETVTPMGRDPYTTGFLLGPQLNLSAGGFRLGVSYLIHSEEGSPARWYRDPRNFRVLVGADLVRLFTGKDTAVVTATDSPVAKAND